VRSNQYAVCLIIVWQVLVRVKQYRDDLLASCLTLILALPKEIVARQMKHIVPAIQVSGAGLVVHPV